MELSLDRAAEIINAFGPSTICYECNEPADLVREAGEVDEDGDVNYRDEEEFCTIQLHAETVDLEECGAKPAEKQRILRGIRARLLAIGIKV
jgi:hypothetical protein